MVDEMLGADGSLPAPNNYSARVRNHGKLARNSRAARLEGNGAFVAGADGNLPSAAVNGVLGMAWSFRRFGE